jgi:CubicO group peptidase (beta-lactamase class C family)
MLLVNKNRKLKIVAVVILVVSIAIGGLNLYSSYQMSKIPSMTFKNMLQYTTENNEDALITVGILKDGEMSYNVYGTNGKVLPKKEYTYEIGSLTKTFTGTLLSKAISEGKIDLNAQINQYLSLPDKDYYPTLKGLVTHTSGYKSDYFDWQMASNFFDGQDNSYYGITIESLLEKIGDVNLSARDYPFEYSNFGISVIGQVLSKIYGEKYHLLMNEYILSELHMNNTRISVHLSDVLGTWDWKENDAYLPAGALVSDISDMMSYLELHMTEALPYLAMTHKSISETDGNTKFSLQMGMRIDAEGMGWMIDEENGLIWHNGGTTDSNNCYLAFDKKRQIGVVILSSLAPNYRIPATVMGPKLIKNLQLKYDQQHKKD